MVEIAREIKFPKRIAIFITVFLLIVAAQYLYFAAGVLGKASAVADKPADAIVIFRGGDGRIAVAYGLNGKQPETRLIISPASRARIDRYDSRYAAGRKIQYIIEARARTTFENALYCSRLIEEHGFNSIVLVTSDYHMPRAGLLMKTLLAGSGVSVQKMAVKSTKYRERSDRLKIAYNEMIDCWGSFGELALYTFSRKIPEKPLKAYRIVQWFKGVVLFKI